VVSAAAGKHKLNRNFPLEKKTMTFKAFRTCLAALLAMGLALPTHDARADDDGEEAIGIRTLSANADRVSGGDVLVQISLPRGVSKGNVTVSLNGSAVTSSFRETAPGTLVGLVKGLALGENELTAEARGSEASLRLTNYPITGPITSGPHIQPFICQTQTFKLPDGTAFGAATDADCSAPTKINYLYMPQGGTAFKAVSSASAVPSTGVATTTTTKGVTVRFVVRVETSTIDRGIYQSAVLHDPASDPEPTPFSPPKGWNGRVVAIEGFGCPGGWYIQGGAIGSISLPGVMDATLFSPSRLGDGYATFSNTLQHASNNCNSVLSAEAAMMGKEHFIETYGPPKYTVSMGCSGGSYGSIQLADQVPGLFDGALIACTFPDPLGIAFSGSDGHLLTHYFYSTDTAGFTQAQQVAVSGYKGLKAFTDAANQAGRTDPVPNRVDFPGYVSAPFSAAVPVALRYDPLTNPKGARGTVYDAARNIYGTNPGTGFALRPFDNVGVQYGLEALNAGKIGTTQFLDLNQNIGGYDQDFNYVASRSVGDPGAIKRAYQSGLQLGGGGGLSSIPVMDITGLYNDDGGYHYQWFHFATRDRMAQANGNADNHVMWRGNPVPQAQFWSTFIQWVEAVSADSSKLPAREKVIRNKPALAVDGCWSNPTTFIAERQTFSSDTSSSRCNALFPSYAFPRYVAGGPLAANNLQCRLKPIDPSGYRVTFTASEISRLQKIFPSGVCDWSKRGHGFRGVVPNASFGPSEVNLVFDITNPDSGADGEDD
jgi:hypothetical protein